MKRILIALIVLFASQEGLYAQQDFQTWSKKSYTDRFFDQANFVNENKFEVDFENKEKMYIKLGDLKDASHLKNLDSLVGVFLKDILFYKDSMTNVGNVAIDYVVTDSETNRIVRFRNQMPQGDIFVKGNAGVSRLKLEQDTVRIILRRPATYWSGAPQNKVSSPKGQYQCIGMVTFCVNDYGNIALLSKKGLNKMVAKMMAQVPEKVTKKRFFLQHTDDYYRYADTGLVAYKGFDYLESHYPPSGGLNLGKNKNLIIKVKMGVGFVTSTVAPTIDLGLQYNMYSPGNFFRSYMRVFASGYYVFNKDIENLSRLQDNMFINFEIGAENSLNQKPFYNERAVWEQWPVFNGNTSMGVGYLFAQNGNFYKGTTLKFFTTIKTKVVSLCPELIVTNDFKQLYPGFTVKVF